MDNFYCLIQSSLKDAFLWKANDIDASIEESFIQYIWIAQAW